MSNFVLIFLCLLIGALIKRTGRFPQSTAHALNSFVIFISMPATVLLQVTALFTHLELGPQLLIPVSMAWILFLMSWGLFSWLGRKRQWTPARTGALILTAGLGNTSFVGFPLLEALHGEKAVQWGVLVDQLGSFLALSTLGLMVASQLGHPRDGVKRSALRQVLSFPPFIALLCALGLAAFGIEFHPLAKDVLARLAGTLVPLALVAVGFQLKLSASVFQRYAKPLGLGLLFKLVLVPMGMCLLYLVMVRDFSFVTRVTILESAMATMITSAVVATDFGLDEELANLMVGVSIPLSLVSVPLWDHLLTFWF